MVITRGLGMSLGCIIRNGKPSLVLGDDHSHMGGSDDMKSAVLIEEILWIW